MKFSVILSSAAVAAAAVINKREVKWEVSKFGANCIGHSTQCSVGFTVIQPQNGEFIGTQCDVRVSAIPGAGGPNVIPDIFDAKCTNSSRTFNLVRSEEGLTLSVAQQISVVSFRNGTHLLPSSDFKITNEPNAWVEAYTGPDAFNLE
ncbi:hypersensitive response-inducing protein [Colletotrichum cereale]|nr:hypersensitive response-inducing protein [Colletotrichum cereale]